MKQIQYENLLELNKPFSMEYVNILKEIIENGWYILGKQVSNFEESFALYCNCRNCIGVASGLDALILSLKAFDFPSGSEVIVPANSYIATILSIVHSNMKPVLVEPDIETYNIDPKKIEEKITNKTVAVLIVHLYGKPCQMDEILYITQKYNLKLIEDCAQAHGAMFNNKKVGTFGEFGAFSFYPTKNLGALGDAGGVITNSNLLAEKIEYLRNYGSKVRYQNEYIGFNSRLDEIQAGFLSIKLKALDSINIHKRKLSKIYLDNLKSDYILPSIKNELYDVFHIFPIRHPKRDKVREYLSKKNIQTDIHYPTPPYKQNALKNILQDSNYPITDEIHKTIISLPISVIHSERDIENVVNAMNSF